MHIFASFTGCPSQSGSLIPCISGVFRIAQAIGSASIMYKIGAAGHPCLAERDIAKNFDMKPFVFIQVFPFLNNI
jgi:hypothetical protein